MRRNAFSILFSLRGSVYPLVLSLFFTLPLCQNDSLLIKLIMQFIYAHFELMDFDQQLVCSLPQLLFSLNELKNEQLNKRGRATVSDKVLLLELRSLDIL